MLHLPRLGLAIIALAGSVALCDGAIEKTSGTVRLERYGVSFRAPRAWFTPDRDKIIENLRKLDNEKEDIDAILATHRGSIAIATYLKHDPRGRTDIIPTINVLGRPNPHDTFEAFREAIAASAHSMPSALRNFVITALPVEQTLAGRRVVTFSAEYDLSTASGDTHRIASTNYAIPCGDIFLQISMSEILPAQNRDVFQRFIESITFDRP